MIIDWIIWFAHIEKRNYQLINVPITQHSYLLLEFFRHECAESDWSRSWERERRKLGGGSERHYRLEGGVTET
jgi:hypothetical protein